MPMTPNARPRSPEDEAPARHFECLAGGGGSFEACGREVVAERPLRIVVDGRPAATLMQTPGAEIELAVGFLLTEGWIRSLADVGAATFCRDGALGAAGEVRVGLARPDSGAAPRNYRDVMSSCGLCGDELIEQVAERLQPFARPTCRVCPADVFALRDAMEANQPLFRRTGGTHAAALAATPMVAGRAVVREDLGRHNALDKAVGAAAGMSFDFARSLLFLSGRLSLEMVAKAARAGIADVAGVSAPSDLAVSLARKLNMFLAGFVRGGAMTVYAGDDALGVA